MDLEEIQAHRNYRLRGYYCKDNYVTGRERLIRTRLIRSST